MNSIDSHGKRLLELCKSNLLRILNGRFGDNSNRYTRYPTKLGDKPSVIDYTLTSKSLLSLIKSLNIEPFTILSDHCCFHTRIMCSNKYSAEVEHEQIKLNEVPNKFIIDKTSLGIFQIAVRSEKDTKTINNYSTAIFLEDQDGIDKALEHLTDFIMNTIYLQITAVEREMYRGGEHDKENFSSVIIFFGYKSHFPEKWGHMPPSPPPLRFLRHCKYTFKHGIKQPKRVLGNYK